MERITRNVFSFHPHLHFLKFLSDYGIERLGMIPVFIVLIMLLMATVNLKAGEPIIIMPVGNSITAGEHYGYPPIPERTGYRKDLYEMLIDSGYNVDFVGSQNHGELPVNDTNWYDWNNEAYPGWRIPAIAEKTRAALKVYKPDILLVHVGTNGSAASDWPPKPGQVMEMLDSINQYSVDNDHPITVFLCQIIKRFVSEDPAPTSLFNQEMADTVATRTGDSINIIIVDMENGAGLDYTDSLPDPTAIPPYEGGDMWGTRYPGTTLDKFHPNDKGNTKMALKFYEELVKVLDPPETIENNKVMGIEFIATPDSFVQMTWTGNFLDEDGYIVERSESGGGFIVLDTVGANKRYFIDTDADVNSVYTYRVKAFNASGESLNSDEVTYTPTFYTLTTSVVGQGSVNPSSGSYLVGTEPVITVAAIPAEGWEFEKWTGDNIRRVDTITVIMNSDISITANFKEIPSQVTTQTKSECSFYPNPVTDKLIIELQNELSQRDIIQLFDNTGRLILDKKVQGLRHIVDMGHLSPGIYLIRVPGNNEETIIKYISKL